MSENIKDLIKTCEACQTYATAQQLLPLQCHELTERPWQCVGIDVFSIKEKQYLATVGYMSNFVEVDRLYSTTTGVICGKLQAHFARYGIPDVVVTDNGPQFSSQEFADFAQTWHFTHRTSSPHHPASNAIAESAVKTLKKTMMKCALDGSNVYQVLLNLRNTPRLGILLSPVQLMMSRCTKTIIPTAKSLLTLTAIPDTMTIRRQQQIAQTTQYNRKAHDVPPLQEGDTARIKPTNLGDKQWIRGTVVRPTTNRTTTTRQHVRRNRVHLRPATASSTTTTKSGHVVKPVPRLGFPLQ